MVRALLFHGNGGWILSTHFSTLGYPVGTEGWGEGDEVFTNILMLVYWSADILSIVLRCSKTSPLYRSLHGKFLGGFKYV
jgi:hypothetical protein